MLATGTGFTFDCRQAPLLYIFVLFMALEPPLDQVLLIHEVSRSHITTHHSRYDFSGRVISSSQRPLPDNTQHSQQTNINAPGGIRTYNLNRRAAADLRLRSRGHWDRPSLVHCCCCCCFGTTAPSGPWSPHSRGF